MDNENRLWLTWRDIYLSKGIPDSRREWHRTRKFDVAEICVSVVTAYNRNETNTIRYSAFLGKIIQQQMIWTASSSVPYADSDFVKMFDWDELQKILDVWAVQGS